MWGARWRRTLSARLGRAVAGGRPGGRRGGGCCGARRAARAPGGGGRRQCGGGRGRRGHERASAGIAGAACRAGPRRAAARRRRRRPGRGAALGREGLQPLAAAVPRGSGRAPARDPNPSPPCKKGRACSWSGSQRVNARLALAAPVLRPGRQAGAPTARRTRRAAGRRSPGVGARRAERRRQPAAASRLNRRMPEQASTWRWRGARAARRACMRCWRRASPRPRARRPRRSRSRTSSSPRCPGASGRRARAPCHAQGIGLACDLSWSSRMHLVHAVVPGLRAACLRPRFAEALPAVRHAGALQSCKTWARECCRRAQCRPERRLCPCCVRVR